MLLLLPDDGERHLHAASPTELQGTAGSALGQSIVVGVVDQNGRGVPNALVAFKAEGDGSVGMAEQLTSATGSATTTWTMGKGAGTQMLTAWLVGNESEKVTFVAWVQPGPVVSIEKVSGNAQVGVVGEELAQDFVVRVLDAHGNPVANQSLSLAPQEAVTSASTVTDANGKFRLRWRLGTAAREYSLRVTGGSGSGAQTVLTATAQAGPISALERVAGDNQSVLEGGTLQDSLVVRAVDRYGNPVPGHSIGWSILAGGGSVGVRAPSQTRADGTAKASWSVGIDLPNRVSATHGGYSTVFNATAIARTPRVWVAVAGPPTFAPAVEYLEISPGAGAAVPADSQLVSVYYTTYREDGTIFKRVRKGIDPPFQFRFNTTPLTVLPAFNAGVRGMREGAIRRLRMPAEHTDGAGMLYFEIELADIED